MTKLAFLIAAAAIGVLALTLILRRVSAVRDRRKRADRHAVRDEISDTLFGKDREGE